jgi:hypothetical protein
MSRLILYPVDRKRFVAEQWEDRLAIVVAPGPHVSVSGQEVSEDRTRMIVGASGYTCTDQLQRFNIFYCDWVNYICIGNYWIYWDLYGCEEAPSGYCSLSLLEARRYSPCLNNPIDPWLCTISGEWTSYFAWACGYEPSQ